MRLGRDLPLPFTTLPVQTVRGVVSVELDETERHYLLQRDDVTVKSLPRRFTSYGLLTAERDRLVTSYGGEVAEEEGWVGVADRAGRLASDVDSRTGYRLTVAELIREVLRTSPDRARAPWGQMTLTRRILTHQTRVHRQTARWLDAPDAATEEEDDQAAELLLRYAMRCPSLPADRRHVQPRW